MTTASIIADAKAGVPSDDEFCTNAGLNAIGNASAGEAKAQ